MATNGENSVKRLTEICQEYNVSVKIAENKIKETGVQGFFSSDMPIFGSTLYECTKIVKNLAQSEKSTKQTMTTQRQTSPQPATRTTSTRTSRNILKNEYLLRDYIVLTQSAVRKKGFPNLIEDFLKKRAQYKSSSTVVMLWASLDIVAREAKKDSSLEKNLKYITKLYEQGLSIMLKGKPDEEREVLTKFIRNNYFNRKSIIVFGDSDGLSQTINYLNTEKREINYITIYERDFLENGDIINPSFNHVFSEVRNQQSVKSKPNKGSISLPSVGDKAYTAKKKPVTLTNIISDNGGEGIIYRTNISGKCAKIFKSRNCTIEKGRKVLKMCTSYKNMKDNNPALIEKIAWPETMLFNENNEFIGYLMQSFENENIQPFSCFNAGNFRTLIPNLKKEHQITMAKKFSELIVFLHKNNVILCDINRGNILFNTKNLEAYIVDIDSAQIADEKYIYCCNVGRQEFLSPEHIKQNDFSFVHKKSDDVWALQMLLFSMLTPLGNAYLTAVDEDESTIIEKGLYPFQAGDNPSQDVAGGRRGRWHIIVSHFPKYLKEYFWESFHNRGKNFHEDNRMTAQDWFYIMLRYEHDINFMIERDSNSGEYDPSEPKKVTDDDLFARAAHF